MTLVNNDGPSSYNLGGILPAINTVPGKIACEPKKPVTIPTKRVGKMEVVDTKQSLTDLTVVFTTYAGSKLALNEGDAVYVYTQSLVQPWGTEVFDLNGKTFILVPEEAVLMVRKMFWNGGQFTWPPVTPYQFTPVQIQSGYQPPQFPEPGK